MNDMKISGAGSISGGNYAHVTVSGAASIDSDIECASLSGSGSVHAKGKINCTGEVKTAGTFSCDGDFTCGECRFSGTAKVKGDMKVGKAKFAGTFKCEKAVEADEFSGVGIVNITGLLNADLVNLDLDHYGPSKIGSVGGTGITIKSKGRVFFFLHKQPSLECDSIEGDKITLEYVKCTVVRGNRVHIGKGCKISRVEYTEDCLIDPDAEVKSQNKTE